MNRELMEAGARVLGAMVETMDWPTELKGSVQELIERMAVLLRQPPPRPVAAGPSIVDDLTALSQHSQRAILNISGTAALVAAFGIDEARIREVVRGHLLQQALHDADTVRALLALPLAAQGPREGLH